MKKLFLILIVGGMLALVYFSGCGRVDTTTTTTNTSSSTTTTTTEASSTTTSTTASTTNSTGSTTTSTPTTATATSTTSTTSTTFRVASALYCYTRGTPEALASPEAHFIGCFVQNNFASRDGTAIPGGIGWSNCYFGTTFEVILVDPTATTRSVVTGDPYALMYLEYITLLNATVETWNIDSTTAKSLADACPTLETWISTRDVNAIFYQYKLFAINGGGIWSILYQQAPGVDCRVLVDATNGSIISATAR